MDKVFWHCPIESYTNRLLQKWAWKSGNIAFFTILSMFLSSLAQPQSLIWKPLACSLNKTMLLKPLTSTRLIDLFHGLSSIINLSKRSVSFDSTRFLLVLCLMILWNDVFFCLNQDYQNFMAYICKVYKGNPKPDACRSVMPDNRHFLENANGGSQGCYVTPTRNSTS